MPHATYVQPDGTHQTVDVPAGLTFMLAAQANSIEGILGECGGQAMCATCHVYVDERYLAQLPPMAEDEDVMLEDTACERLPNSRLACQLKAGADTDGILFRLPAEQV